MKKMILIGSVMLFTSCLTTRTSVGTYTEKEGKEYTYAKGKQIWLFWGLLPMGRVNVNTPGSGECEIITQYTAFDMLLSGVTIGIVTTYTIKVKAKK